MRDYQEFYAKTFLNFKKIPVFESDGNNDERFIADVLLSFKIYDAHNENRKQPRETEEFSISSAVINNTLKTFVIMVNEINNLKNNESTGSIHFFDSAVANSDKNGVGFVFTQQENNDLIIKIEFKSKDRESLIIRTSNTQFYAAIIDFVNLTLELINNMTHIPLDFKELTTIRLYNVIAVIPLLP
jgi:hypothetical protein